MAIGLNSSLRNARAQKIIDALDAGASNGKINFYNGTRPSTGGLVTALLATCDLSDPCASVTNGIITFNAIYDDVSADADGVITWARFVDSDTIFVLDCSCGTAGSGADIIFNTTQTKTGGAVQIISAVLTEGSA